MQASLRKNFRAGIVSTCAHTLRIGFLHSAGFIPSPCMRGRARGHLPLKFLFK